MKSQPKEQSAPDRTSTPGYRIVSRPLTGAALEASRKEKRELLDRMAKRARAIGLTEEKVIELLKDAD